MQNPLSDADIILGETVRKLLASVPRERQKKLTLSMRSFYSSAAMYLATRLPLNNELLSNLSYMQPSQSVLPESTKAVHSIAQTLHNIRDDDIAAILDEWRQYQNDDLKPDEYTSAQLHIDHYWRSVMSLKGADGNYKYVKLSKLLKSAIVLPHGNADVEAWFFGVQQHLDC